MHRGAIFQFLFQWIYYCHSSKSNGKETGKTHLCAMTSQLNFLNDLHVLRLVEWYGWKQLVPRKELRFRKIVSTLLKDYLTNPSLTLILGKNWIWPLKLICCWIRKRQSLAIMYQHEPFTIWNRSPFRSRWVPELEIHGENEHQDISSALNKEPSF